MRRDPNGGPARLALPAVAATLALLAAGCSGSGDDPNTITIAYQKYGTFQGADKLMTKVKKEFEAANRGVTIELRPIEAPPEDYQSQVNLMNQSTSEAPDIMYEDTFTINQDVDAGYLAPLDAYWDDWEDADQYNEQADEPVTARDGHRYGVMLGTDTRGIWYNTKLFREAGIDTPWKPGSWKELLDTARTLDSELSDDVTPLHVYGGTPVGEMTSMQGFQMLLSGTGDTLYDERSQKWRTGTEGFADALRFYATVYGEDLALPPEDVLDPNLATMLNEEWIPAGEVAMSLEGSWATQSWVESATKPWPEWADTMDFVPMPTQHGQKPGATSMSGGWALSLNSKSSNPDLAWKVMKETLNKENATKFAVEGGQTPVRDDVAESTEFREATPKADQASDLVDVTHFRPSYTNYPRLTLKIQEATESVMLGEATAEQAARTYDEEVAAIVGPDKVTGDE